MGSLAQLPQPFKAPQALRVDSALHMAELSCSDLR